MKGKVIWLDTKPFIQTETGNLLPVYNGLFHSSYVPADDNYIADYFEQEMYLIHGSWVPVEYFKNLAEEKKMFALLWPDVTKLKEEKQIRDAAPDLLEALQAFVNDLDMHPSPAAREHYEPLVSKAKAAIQKATGKLT